MDYLSFFKKLRQSDSRVAFTEASLCLTGADVELPAFYRTVNPVQVEFEFNDGIVKLEPLAGLPALNEMYPYITEGCVFATCNGDPIYMKDGKIFTCVHGSKRMIEEKIADSLEAWLKQISNTL